MRQQVNKAELDRLLYASVKITSNLLLLVFLSYQQLTHEKKITLIKILSWVDLITSGWRLVFTRDKWLFYKQRGGE